jgi:hypothetical protein
LKGSAATQAFGRPQGALGYFTFGLSYVHGNYHRSGSLVGALIFASQLIIFLLILRFKSENKTGRRLVGPGLWFYQLGIEKAQ